jgi:hypothetical protein
MLRLRPRRASGDRRRAGVVGGAWIVALRLALPSDALAEEPCPSRASWVRVDVHGAAPDFARRVLEDLRAGLAGSRVGACAEDLAGNPPLAVVRVVPSRARPTRYAIDVSDAVTRKRLVRDVDLARVPPDGRAFAVAVAAEELLRASWAELELRDRKRETPAASPVSPPATPSPEAQPPPSRSNGDALGARFALEHYAHGQTQFGGDVSWSRPLVSSIGFTFAFGVRKGLDTDSEHGRVQSSAFGAELALEPRLVSWDVVSLQLPVALRGVRVTFSGRAADGAIAREHSGFALFARAGLSLMVAPGGAFRARTSAGAGAPLRSFSASDAGERITGLGGLELFAHTGVAVEF